MDKHNAFLEQLASDAVLRKQYNKAPQDLLRNYGFTESEISMITSKDDQLLKKLLDDGVTRKPFTVIHANTVLESHKQL
ncbi:hypothetical protein FLM48_14835 [Shewanella sp. Scap07]|uniref:hypothetical protein n=1 Tax=Shewanella sp. Scap07 TaxID=2589987 RepID=UPI0015BF2537|nr:hypothetical protein [Shewanella sp. Scap07]QLE86234.1 hypothetical protein FLM48_14835 [Shewanella sp. Scap07]